jgi:hypothetical protein
MRPPDALPSPARTHLRSNLHFVNSAAATHFSASCPNFNGILLLSTTGKNTELVRTYTYRNKPCLARGAVRLYG